MTESDELRAVVRARQELGAEYEPELVDSFLEKIEKGIDARAAGKPAVRETEHRAVTPMVLGSLGLAIPLLAIAGGTAGLAGVALVTCAIVLVNVLAIMLRR